MSSKHLNNKWLSGAIPALMLHCSIGFVYCWSLFKANIATSIGESVSSIELAFSLAIFFLGMSAAFCGNLVEKNVKLSAFISTLFFTAGMIGTGVAIQCQSLVGVCLSYGVIMGIGLGIGYLTPVKTLLLWFKENKGLATGIAITGFGLAKVIASPAIEYLLSVYPVQYLFYILGGIYATVMLISALLIKKPTWAAEFKGEHFNLNKSVKIILNPTYIAIWVVFFINITCGLALISQEKALLQSVGVVEGIAIIAAMTALFNAVGRFGYSTLSDMLKNRTTVYEIIFLSSGISCLLFCINPALFAVGTIFIALILCNLGYGGGFSTLPSLLSDKFGMKNVSVIHGFCLSAWAWAGLAGNNLGYFMLSNFGSMALFILLGVLYLAAFVITWHGIAGSKSKVKA